MTETQSNITTQSQNDDRDVVPTDFSSDTKESFRAVRESIDEVYEKHINRHISPEIRKLIQGTGIFISHVSNDPYVHHKVQQAINQTTSKLYDSYEWTRNSAEWAIDKTAEAIYDQYGFAKQKANQRITTAKEQIPWDKINQIATSVPVLNALPNMVLPNLANLYRRPSTPASPTEAK